MRNGILPIEFEDMRCPSDFADEIWVPEEKQTLTMTEAISVSLYPFCNIFYVPG